MNNYNYVQPHSSKKRLLHEFSNIHIIALNLIIYLKITLDQTQHNWAMGQNQSPNWAMGQHQSPYMGIGQNQNQIWANGHENQLENQIPGIQDEQQIEIQS